MGQKYNTGGPESVLADVRFKVFIVKNVPRQNDFVAKLPKPTRGVGADVRAFY